MNRFFPALVMMFAATALCAREAATGAVPRTRELGLVAYKKPPAYNHPRNEKGTLDYLKAFCPSVEIIPEDTDIFLPENRAKLAAYKRVWIPDYAAMFTKPMIEGMTYYVENGGLLISCETMPLIDVDGDNAYQPTTDKQFSRHNTHPALGISGVRRAVNYRAIKLVKPTPFTEGLGENQWLPISGSGRWVTNAPNVDVLVIAQGQWKKSPEFEQPFLTCKRRGKGAAIYLAAVNDNETIKKIVAGALSEKTRNWLIAEDAKPSGR